MDNKTKHTMKNFSQILQDLKEGKQVQRIGWNGKGMYLQLIGHYEIGVIDFELLPFIGMKTADNKFVPWLASQTDILADDWQIVI